MMTSNVPEVLSQMVRGFEDASKLIKEAREATRGLATDLRSLGRGTGLSGLLKTLEKLGSAKIGGSIVADMDKMRTILRETATAQAEMAKSSVETARAWKDIAAAGGRGGRRGGGAGAPPAPGGPWSQAERDAYPDAQYENRNYDARSRAQDRAYRSDQRMAERENQDRDVRARAAEAAAAKRYADDHALAHRENADVDARARTAAQRSRQSHAHGMDAALGAQMAGDAGMGLVERGFHAYADVQQQQIMAQADSRITDAVMTQANTLVANLQKKYPALTQAEGLTVFRNTMGIFGNARESMDAMPDAVRLQQLYQLAPLGRGGTGGSEVQAAEKAGDAMQAFIDPKTQQLDKGLYKQWMDFQARSYLAGGGLVDAKGWLAFSRTARSAGIGLNPRALEETQALLEMSPGRTGTALMSAFQVFGASTSHMTKQNKAAWGKAGLLGKDGNIVDQGLYQQNPFEWVWKDLVPRLQAQGLKTREQLLKWLTDHGQRGTVAGILSDIAIGQTPITNTANKMDAQDPNAVDKLVNSDIGKLAALQAAETNFFVAVGKFGEGPGLMVLTKLTDALNALTKLANDHPEAAKWFITTAGGMALMSKAAGDVAMTIYLGAPMVQGMAALARAVLPFGKGGEAELAIATAAGGAGVAGSLAALAAAIVLLPPALKMGVEAMNSALGITPPQSGSAAKGAGHGPWTSSNHPAGQSWSDWWHGLSQPLAGGTVGGGRGSVHATKSAYVTGSDDTLSGRPIILMVDGRVLGQVVGGQLDRSSRNSASVQFGRTAHDGRMTPVPTTTLA